ncbi:MAG: PAS domain S-box protein [Desulfomonile sp.]|nr:PAS domain S-box protein [Desulfomonile sp.]
MAHIFGYTVKQLVDGRGPKDLVADEDWPQVKEYLRQRLEGEIESVNYSFKRMFPKRLDLANGVTDQN